MGATEFTQFQTGLDPVTTFRGAVEAAAWEYGHGGYSGTLAEKDELTVVSDDGISLYEATEMAEKLMQDSDERIIDKWGPAGGSKIKETNKEGLLVFGFDSS